jgi:hypothetical protein
VAPPTGVARADGGPAEKDRAAEPASDESPYPTPPPRAIGVAVLGMSAFLKENSTGASAMVTVGGLRLMYRASPLLSFTARQLVANAPTLAGAPGGTVPSNPVVGTTFSFRLDELVTTSVATEIAVPVGGASGDAPPPGELATRRYSHYFDRMAFRTNHASGSLVAGITYLGPSWAARLGAGVEQFVRTRGAEEPTLTNVKAGIDIGTLVYSYFEPFASGEYLRIVSSTSQTRIDPASAQQVIVRAGLRFLFKGFTAEAAYERPVASVLFTRNNLQAVSLVLGQTVGL